MAQEYSFNMVIVLEGDGIKIEFTGKEVKFDKLTPDAIIRPRHAKLVTDITSIIKDAVK
jgi:hypothetical protein